MAATVIAMVVLMLGLIGGLVRLSQQIHDRSVLCRLSAASVASIQVGKAHVVKTADIDDIVVALRESRWYVPTAGDGGWAEPVDVVVHLKSGDEMRYQVGRMLKRDGAMIGLVSQNQSSVFAAHHGYAWAATLPHALDNAGISLPTERKKP